MKTREKALVLFSGGQDSATCLAWALACFNHIGTIGFDYGQRHLVEMQCRQVFLEKMRAQFPGWGKKLGKDTVLDLSVLGDISETALTRNIGIRTQGDAPPNTFIPGRNLVFLNIAAALAYKRGCFHLVAGMCQTDFSGYPDCRRETLDATMTSISLGMDQEFTLHTPLMNCPKAGAWALAKELGGRDLLELIVEYSHTCYIGKRGGRHDWGYGCGTCPACKLRAQGWATYKSGACNR